MSDDLIELEVVQVNTPWDFKARIKSADSSELQEFQDMFERMNQHFNHEQMITAISYNHRPDEICVGKSSKDKMWHRVRVEQTLSTKTGPQTSCVFVDEGCVELIPLSWVKYMPETFGQVPFQVKQLSLQGIQPLSMVISAHDLESKVRPVRKWDSSAVDFMKKRVAAAQSIQAVIQSVGQSDDTIFVKMYLHLNQGVTCLNDDLVMFNFATDQPEQFEDGKAYSDLPNSMEALTKRPTIDEMMKLKAKRLEAKSATSQASLSSKDLVYSSEPEMSFSSRKNVNYSTNSALRDTGYNTDSLELKIPHRRNKQADRQVESGSQYAPHNQADASLTSVDDRNVKSQFSQKHHDNIPIRSFVKSPLANSTSDAGRCERTIPNPTSKYSPLKDNHSLGLESASSSNVPNVTSPHSPHKLSPLQNIIRSSKPPVAGRGSVLEAVIKSAAASSEVKPRSRNISHELEANTSTGTYSQGQSSTRTSLLHVFDECHSVSTRQSPYLSTGHSHQNSSTHLSPNSGNQNFTHSAIPLLSSDKTQKSCAVTKLEALQNAMEKSPLGSRSGSFSSSSEGGLGKLCVGRGIFSKAASEKLTPSPNRAGDATTALFNMGRGRTISVSSDVEKDDSANTLTSVQLGNSSGSESVPVSGEFVFKKARLPKQSTLTNQKQASVPTKDTSPEKASVDIGAEMFKADSRRDSLLKKDDAQKKLEMKFISDKILKMLSPNCRPGATERKTVTKQGKPVAPGMFGVEDNVVVHGSGPSRPFIKFNEAHMSEQVRQVWLTKEYPSPTLIQAYTWPPILKGRHMVAIAPDKTGKTFAYLLPLITYLAEIKLYSEVPIGNGPHVIILTSTSNKAGVVFKRVMKLTGGHRNMRAILAHGGGQEDTQACKLLNGCEILVVTAPCLGRLIDKRYTDLSRLCHLVVDDANEVLETFTKDVRQIMEMYMCVIKDHSSQHLDAPRQILLFGSQWSEAIESFVKGYLVDPLLVITSLFEASIYGKVKQEAHVCKIDQKIRKLTSLLEVIQDEDSKTLIFCSKKDDINSVHRILMNCSYFSLMIHQDMSLFEIRNVTDQWATSQLLVSCDEHALDLKISNAKTVIHYDMPTSRTRFNNRLSCMRRYFRDFSRDTMNASNSGSEVIVPTSHIIISEDCTQQVKSITELLKRSKSVVPVKLKAMLAGVKQGEDEDVSRNLCPYILAYGFCKSHQCRNRHLVFPEVDAAPNTDWLPDEGEVKVHVTNVVDANHFFVRLLSIREEDGQEKDLTPVYIRLQMDLMQWYSNPKHCQRHTAPYSGEICGYKDKDNYYRVEIIDILDMNRQEKGAKQIEAKVTFVDTGGYETISALELFVLPPQLKTVPYQAVEVVVCRVKPIDGDMDWTRMADSFMYKLIQGKTLEGKIVLRLGTILWLDPLVERVIHPTTNIVINKTYIHTELKDNGLADDNPEHLEKLYKICEGKVKISKAMLKKTRCTNPIDMEVLPLGVDFHDVLVSSVSQPDLFFVQRRIFNNSLEELMEEVNKYMSDPDTLNSGADLTVGKLCLAKYTSGDSRWHRGQIIKAEDDTYQVFFVDYGDQDTVIKENVCVIPKDMFQNLPMQAIECHLAAIKPRGESWDEMAGDALWDMSHFVNGDMKTLVAKVISTELSSFAGNNRFVIDLFNTEAREDINIAQELVWMHLADTEETATICDLFNKPSPMKRGKMYTTALEKVTDLCANIHWETTSSTKALQYAQEVNSILTSAIKDRNDEELWVEAVHSVLKLIGRVHWADVHVLILDCVCVCSRVSDRLCEEMIGAGCVGRILVCLELNSETTVQIHAAEIIAQMSSASDVLKTEFGKEEILSILKELLESSPSQEVQGSLCKAFTGIAAGSDSVYEQLLDDCCVMQTLCKLLMYSSSHVTTENVILLLSVFTAYNSSHPELKKETLIDTVVKTLGKTNCDKCIQHCVQLCDNFAALRRKHKTLLLEHEMVPVLTRIVQLNLSSTTRQMCKDLLSSLVVKVPSEPISGVALRPDNSNLSHSTSSSARGLAPPVSWSQNTYKAMLSVKVTGVVQSHDMVTMDENILTFKATVEGINYYFTYQLYDSILPAKSCAKVKTFEVLISMRKVNKGKWPRLLHQKQKPVNLSVDYERFLDSSSEDEVFDESQPFVLKQKKKKLFQVPTKKPVTKVKAVEGETIYGSSSESDSVGDTPPEHGHESDDFFKL